MTITRVSWQTTGRDSGDHHADHDTVAAADLHVAELARGGIAALAYSIEVGWICDVCGCGTQRDGRCKYYDGEHERYEGLPE